jgi:hypothetical protein
MDLYMAMMLKEGMLRRDDLDQFSSELRESLLAWTENR